MPLPDVFNMIAKTAEWFAKPDNRGLDTFDRVFLRMGQLAEDVGIGGDKLKIYNRVVGRGDTSPITEKDLSPKSMKFLSDMVNRSYTERGDGAFRSMNDYNTYGPKMNLGFNELHPSLPPKIMGMDAVSDAYKHDVYQVLGRFNYAKDKDDGSSINISDTYDFNYPFAGTKNPLVRALTAITGPRNYAVDLAHRVVPPGKGAPVNIKIPRKP